MSSEGYVLLFRGINVGGSKKVQMATLRSALTGAGLENVATYIQSGNVVLTTDLDEAALVSLIDTVFVAEFGFSSRPTVRSIADWRRLIDENPFRDSASDGKQVHSVLLDGTPAPAAVDNLKSLATTEEIEVREGVLYLYTPDGFGRSKVAESLDRVLKVPLTARNWNTVLKLQEMALALPTT